MAGSHPGLGIHENSGVKANVVLVLLNELFQPGVLDVVLQQNTKRAVVPCISKTAVDLRAGVNEALRLTQINDLVHYFFIVFQHKGYLISK